MKKRKLLNNVEINNVSGGSQIYLGYLKYKLGDAAEYRPDEEYGRKPFFNSEVRNISRMDPDYCGLPEGCGTEGEKKFF